MEVLPERAIESSRPDLMQSNLNSCVSSSLTLLFSVLISVLVLPFLTCWSVTQLCPTLCNPMDYSTPGFPVLLELAQNHVYWVGDAIQPSCPLCPLLLLPSIFPSIKVFSNESAIKKSALKSQHIKKQRHYFVNKGPYSQVYGFSSGHIWMWELDYKESWVLKNWCF